MLFHGCCCCCCFCLLSTRKYMHVYVEWRCMRLQIWDNSLCVWMRICMGVCVCMLFICIYYVYATSSSIKASFRVQPLENYTPSYPISRILIPLSSIQVFICNSTSSFMYMRCRHRLSYPFECAYTYLFDVSLSFAYVSRCNDICLFVCLLVCVCVESIEMLSSSTLLPPIYSHSPSLHSFT